MIFHVGNSTCSKEGKAAKELIIDTFNWDIQEGGESEGIPSYPIGIIAIISLFAIGWITQKTIRIITALYGKIHLISFLFFSFLFFGHVYLLMIYIQILKKKFPAKILLFTPSYLQYL